MAQLSFTSPANTQPGDLSRLLAIYSIGPTNADQIWDHSLGFSPKPTICG